MAVKPKSPNPLAVVADDIVSTDPDPLVVAAYIGDMSVSLRGMADQSNHTFLAYLLDLVYEESTIIARKTNCRPIESGR